MSSPAMDSISVSDIDVAPSTQTQATIKTLPDELLLAVLGELSIKDRAKVRTVSKKWNDLVMDLGIHLEPLFVDEQQGVPFYSNDNAIRLNIWANSYDFHGQFKLADDLQVPYSSLTRMESYEMMYYTRSQFLTDPPISTLALQVIGPPGSSIRPMHAILRTATRTMKGSGGLRCGDLLDVFDKMRAYDTTLSLAGWDFAGWFATNGDGVDYDYVCKWASTKSGIEVRKCTGNGD